MVRRKSREFTIATPIGDAYWAAAFTPRCFNRKSTCEPFPSPSGLTRLPTFNTAVTPTSSQRFLTASECFGLWLVSPLFASASWPSPRQARRADRPE